VARYLLKTVAEMRSSLLGLGFVLGVAVAGCGDDTVAEIHNARIDPIRQPCVGAFKQMCLSAIDLDDPSQAQTLLYFGIEGYEHAWGVTAEVVFSVEPIAEPVADGPSSRQIAQEVTVVERARAGDRFSLRFPDFGGDGTPWFALDADTNATTMIDDTVVTCFSSSLCSALFAFDDFVVEFEFDYGGALVVVGVEPADR
jgi:hypothetical protein